jgi:hypothetical protein
MRRGLPFAEALAGGVELAAWRFVKTKQGQRIVERLERVLIP